MQHAFHQITEEEIRAIGAYEIESHEFLPDINSDSFVLWHKKSGARVAILPNTDSNKVFYIGFRTPPKDSTGVAHIIEHTVLCGSRDFPVRDPFIEVVKGSLNTFLNAMTYPDKTVYPVASTNEKDFDNLMHVYLDAVFHPNIYREENIFRQEGWHYEPVSDHGDLTKDEEEAFLTGKGALTVNGVVYNEMRGVMSNPDDVLADKVLASLYPHTTYSIVSGGDPDVIPSLTYQDYLHFHETFYHPSNSYIYLYGDMDMQERLTYLDRAYLSDYDYLAVDSEIHGEGEFTVSADKDEVNSAAQGGITFEGTADGNERNGTGAAVHGGSIFSVPTQAQFSYSVMEDEDTAQKTYLSLNFALPDGRDPKTDLAYKVLDYVLCESEGAPVKEALRKKGIGQDVDSLYDSGVLEPYYSITAKYADAAQKDEFVSTVFEVIQNLADKGIDRKSLLAGINYFEFHYREADFGSYPKGLIFGLDAMDTWLYDDRAVWQNLRVGGLFDELRKGAESGYFENILRRSFLENRHRSTVLLVPEPGLTAKKDEEKKASMRALYEGMSRQKREEVLQNFKSLRKWQETPDSKEALSTIPTLSRADLTREARKILNEELPCGEIKVLAHPVFTGGIDYVKVLFDAGEVPERLFPYLNILKVLLTALSTEHYTYAELDHEINIQTGGISCGLSLYTDVHDPQRYRTALEISSKVLHGNFRNAMDLLREVILHTKWDDLTRIREVLEEELSGAKTGMPASGHETAVNRASAGLSPSSKVLDDLSGIGGLRDLQKICRDFDNEGDKLPAALQELSSCLFRRDKVILVDLTAPDAAVQEDLPVIEELSSNLPSGSVPADGEKRYVPDPEPHNEAFTTAGQIQFVCAAGDFSKKNLPYTGALRVLKVIMAYDYLWTGIRVKGGAYGCMSDYGRDGIAYMVTYRDPHLKRSLDVFRKAGEYIRTLQADEKTLTKYVIGAISSLDRPKTPSAYGRFCLSAYMTGGTEAMLQKARNEVLDVTLDDIHALGDYLDAVMDNPVLCVIGGAQKIEGAKDLFERVEPLI